MKSAKGLAEILSNYTQQPVTLKALGKNAEPLQSFNSQSTSYL